MPSLEVLEPPLALGFHAAERPDIAAGCDLDNALTPVVKGLRGDDTLSFVWATRDAVAVGQADRVHRLIPSFATRPGLLRREERGCDAIN